MLVNRSQTVSLSFISTDLPIRKTIIAEASMFQTDSESFHLSLNQHDLPHSVIPAGNQPESQQGMVWLNISPYRLVMTMQSNGQLSYRHFWERGIYGVSRYCLNTDLKQSSQSFFCRNFTRYFWVENNPYPKSVRIEYELWALELCLGSYLMHLEID